MNSTKTRNFLPVKIFAGLVIFFVTFFLTFVGAFGASTKKISYELEYQAGDPGFMVVTLTFKGDDNGQTAVSLPMPWGGMNDAHRGLSAISCLNAGCTVERASNTETAVFVNHAPGEEVTLGYTLAQNWSGAFTNEVRYRPHMTPDYFFLIGHTFMVTPDNYQGHPVELEFTWKGLPDHWAKMTSFGTGPSFKTVVASLDDLRSATYTAGDYRVFGDEIRGIYTFVAVRGNWPFVDKDFTKLTTDTIRNIRGFWNDYNTDQYLVTLIPIAGRCCSYGGTGLTDSFALFVTEENAQLGKFESLLGHELLHNWIGGALRLEGPEERAYWFTEGFTNYYSRLLRLRGGQMNLEEYAADYNAKLAEYFMSPARNETLSDVEEKFWTDKDTGELPYLRGDILAHNWNAGIKDDADGTSLDTFMMDLIGLGKNEVSLAEFDEAIERHLERSFIPDFESYLVAGNTIDLDPTALGACFSISEVEKTPFDLGFTHTDSSKEEVYWDITSVVPGSPAEEAGLRPGMEVVNFSFYWGDIENPIDIGIKDGEGRRQISYLARGPGVMVPQYVLDEREFQRHPEDCMAWFLEN